MDDIFFSGSNGNEPEGERPEPFNASSQSPGEPEIYWPARMIAGVVTLGLDVKLLDLLTGRSFVGNPTGDLAKAVSEFFEKYNRPPTFREYGDIVTDVLAATPDGANKIGKDAA